MIEGKPQRALDQDASSEDPNNIDAVLHAWRTNVLNSMLLILAAIVFPVVAFVIYVEIVSAEYIAAATFGALYLILLSLALFRNWSVYLRAWVLLGLLYSAGVIALARGGLTGDGRVYLFAIPILSVILIGMRKGIFMVVLGALTYAAFGILAHLGILESWLIQRSGVSAGIDWLYAGTVMYALMAMVVLLLMNLYRFQQKIRQSERQATAKAEQAFRLLEEKNLALQHTNDQLQQLSRQLITAQEHERANIARELHDEVLGQLGAMVITLSDQTSPDVTMENYQFLINRLRQTIQGLRPPMLSFGLRAGLDQLVDDLSDRHGNQSRIVIEMPSSDARFDPEAELHLYRIVQQACENAIRHAQANAIHIHGFVEPNIVVLTISDDGIGFDAKSHLEVADLLSQKHFGLAGMMERAALIKAEVNISSIPGKGTTVSLRWNADALSVSAEPASSPGPVTGIH